MLSSNNILEMAYRSDYLTTVELLKVYPELNTDDFWEEKWEFMYPNKKSIQFLTNQDVFLMEERKNFVFVMNHNKCSECGGLDLYKNVLYEDDGTLRDIFVKYSDIEEKDLSFVPIYLKAQFIVMGIAIIEDFNKYEILNQFDYFNEAEDFIGTEVRDNGSTNFTMYQIIDMDHIVICFMRMNMERKPNNNSCLYNYYSERFRRLQYRSRSFWSVFGANIIDQGF